VDRHAVIGSVKLGRLYLFEVVGFSSMPCQVVPLDQSTFRLGIRSRRLCTQIVPLGRSSASHSTVVNRNRPPAQRHLP